MGQYRLSRRLRSNFYGSRRFRAIPIGSKLDKGMRLQVANIEALKVEYWHIRLTLTITLVKGKLGELALEAKKFFPTEGYPQGTISGLAKALGMTRSTISAIINGERDTIALGRLLKLLDILKVPYGTLTPYIRSVGGGGANTKALVNPKFPIDLYNPYGARLLAAALKDGHIAKGRHHFLYANYDPENRRIVTEAVQRVFGEIEPRATYDLKGKQNGIVFTSAVVGKALLRAGAVEGRKTLQVYGLPALVKFGGHAIANAFFEQAIRDDGCRDLSHYRIKITCAREIESLATQEHLGMFELLFWETRPLVSGLIQPYLCLTEDLEGKLPDELKLVYEDFITKMEKEWVPKILKEEQEVIEKTYGVKAKIVPKQMYVGEKTGIKGFWDLVVTGKEYYEKMVKQLDSVWKKGGDGEHES